MRKRSLAALIAVAVFSQLGVAEILPFSNLQGSAWNATHIVVVDGKKVVESWKGDLKPGNELPAGAAKFAALSTPGSDQWSKLAGEPEPVVSGKRKVLFLSFTVPNREDAKKPEWMGAHWSTHPFNAVTAAADVAWVENGRVYIVYQPINPGPYALTEDGGFDGLKQRVVLGLAMRAQFDAAKSVKDLSRRAEQISVLVSFVSKYAGSRGEQDCFEELRKCGKPAAIHFTKWILEPKAEFAKDALQNLCWLGDVGFDGMLKVFEAEIAYWKAVADNLADGDWVDLMRHKNEMYRWRGPDRLLSILTAAHRMKLSAENQQRLSKHTGLIELEKTMRTKQGMKPENTDMEKAHIVLKDILAGKFRKDE